MMGALRQRPSAFAIRSAVAWGLMLILLDNRLLDAWIPGTWHGNVGLDFFSVPSAFVNWKAGHGVFAQILSFGPNVSGYVYHPILAFAVGSWASLLKPWTAYRIFVLFSLALLNGAAWLLRRALQRAGLRAWFLPEVLLLSVPTYLMLWNAQMHVFVVTGAVCVLAGLTERYRSAKLSASSMRWICAGLALSLFSKPLLLLAVPALLMIRELRRPMLITLLIYAAVSAVFIGDSSLNPGDILHEHSAMVALKRAVWRPQNAIQHWSIIAAVSRGGGYAPEHVELFSLPVAIGYFFRLPGYTIAFLLPMLAVFAGIAGTWIRPATVPLVRNVSVLLLVIAALLAYFLSYSVVWEYHYTVLLPLVPVLYALSFAPGCESGRKALRWAALALLLTVLPSPYFFTGNASRGALTFVRGFRLVPVVAAFCGVGYALVSLRRADRNGHR